MNACEGIAPIAQWYERGTVIPGTRVRVPVGAWLLCRNSFTLI